MSRNLVKKSPLRRYYNRYDGRASTYFWPFWSFFFFFHVHIQSRVQAQELNSLFFSTSEELLPLAIHSDCSSWSDSSALLNYKGAFDIAELRQQRKPVSLGCINITPPNVCQDHVPVLWRWGNSGTRNTSTIVLTRLITSLGPVKKWERVEDRGRRQCKTFGTRVQSSARKCVINEFGDYHLFLTCNSYKVLALESPLKESLPCQQYAKWQLWQVIVTGYALVQSPPKVLRKWDHFCTRLQGGLSFLPRNPEKRL